MRIQRLDIQGYGRFVDCRIEFTHGLQVVYGPNERGKSTIRSFVAHMLYGQKRSSTQRLYEDSHALYRPWNGAAVYGGRLVYTLDDHRSFEVVRGFDRDAETVQLFDCSRDEEITHQFNCLRNREPQFAEQHLGIGKTVFAGAATISHLNLDALGDDGALPQIREQILALADSGDERNSAETALRALRERLAAIGRPNAYSRPVARIRSRLLQLDEERQVAQALRNTTAELESRRKEVEQEIKQLRQERDTLLAELELIEKADRAQRLREAEELARAIGEATKRCFSLSNVREFPLERNAELSRIENGAATARTQLQRTETEREDLIQQLEDEQERLGGAEETRLTEIAEDWEERIAESDNRLGVARDRLDAAEEALNEAESRAAAAQQDLDALPDFSAAGSDPIEWFNQSANTFQLHVRSRNAERDECERLRAELDRCVQELEAPENLFNNSESLVQEVRDLDVEMRVAKPQAENVLAQVDGLRASCKEQQASIPGFRGMAIIMAVAGVGLAPVIYYTSIPGLLIPEGLLIIAFLFFLLNYFQANRLERRQREQLAELDEQSAALQEAQQQRRVRIAELLNQAGVSSLRELEALYERYRQLKLEYRTLSESLESQQEKVAEEEAHVASLFEYLQNTFAQFGETLEQESDVPDASRRIISLYQQYRDARRRLAEARDTARLRRDQCEQCRAETQGLNEENVKLCLTARDAMRKAGFLDERKHASALQALRAYRIRYSRFMQRRGRLDLLERRLDALEAQIQKERNTLEESEAELARFLQDASVSSVEEWRQREVQAREYREVRAQRSSLQQQMDALLRGHDLNALREAVIADGPAPEQPERPASEVKAALHHINERIESCVNEEHQLRVDIASNVSDGRSINEIEEEQAVLKQRLDVLEFEFEAAGYAAALIEEVARDKHALIAPRLAQVASTYLGEITDGAYRELRLNQNMDIQVRIPELDQVDKPAGRLSTGTVDQIYLALRLALVQSLSETGESIPMLLDDPFSNYDDNRLRRSLELLNRLASRCQIILFTCREDVAEAARARNAAVLTL